MIDSLAIATVVYSLGVCLFCLGAAATGRPRPIAATASLIVLEVAALLQALMDGVALVCGDHGAEVVTNIGYLLTSVAVIPVSASAVRGDPGRWGSAALAVGCALMAVVTIRMRQTLGTPVLAALHG